MKNGCHLIALPQFWSLLPESLVHFGLGAPFICKWHKKLYSLHIMWVSSYSCLIQTFCYWTPVNGHRCYQCVNHVQWHAYGFFLIPLFHIWMLGSVLNTNENKWFTKLLNFADTLGSWYAKMSQMRINSAAVVIILMGFFMPQEKGHIKEKKPQAPLPQRWEWKINVWAPMQAPWTKV